MEEMLNNLKELNFLVDKILKEKKELEVENNKLKEEIIYFKKIITNLSLKENNLTW